MAARSGGSSGTSELPVTSPTPPAARRGLPFSSLRTARHGEAGLPRHFHLLLCPQLAPAPKPLAKSSALLPRRRARDLPFSPIEPVRFVLLLRRNTSVLFYSQPTRPTSARECMTSHTVRAEKALHRNTFIPQV